MLSWFKFKKTPKTDERRQIVRRRLYLDVVCHMPVEGQFDRDFKAVIIDIGPGGMKLRSYESLTRGNKFFVEYPETIPGVHWTRVQCGVVWAVKSKVNFETTVGLSYLEPPANMAKSWVKFVLEDVGFTPDTLRERRQSIRAPVATPGKLLGHDPSIGEMEAAGKITSLSMGGATVETSDPIMQGREVKLFFLGSEFKGLMFRGKVIDVKAQEKKFLHSIVFESVTPDQRKVLAGYLQRFMRETAPK